MLKVLQTKVSGYSDGQLFEGLLDNKKDVLEYIYREFYPMVRQKIRQLGGQEDDARDIFQEGLLATWQNARSGKFVLQEGVRLSTYLVRVCHLRWLDKTKKASSRREQAVDAFQEQGTNDHVLSRWLKREDQVEFARMFAQLGERCQNLLRLFYFERQDLVSIALELNIGERSVKNEKYRCMQRLKKIYQQK